LAVGAVGMAAKRQRSPYLGVLALPITPPLPPAFWGAVTPARIAAYQRTLARHNRKASAAIEQQLLKRFSLLFDHYDIKNKNDTAALAWALAFEHVPGFKVEACEQKSKRGRKRKWDGNRLNELLEAVRSVKQQYRLSTDKAALRCMVKNPQLAITWGPPPNHKHTKREWIDTLENKLTEAKGIERRAAQISESLRQVQQRFLSKTSRK
jgi:hypothetical protein